MLPVLLAVDGVADPLHAEQAARDARAQVPAVVQHLGRAPQRGHALRDGEAACELVRQVELGADLVRLAQGPQELRAEAPGREPARLLPDIVAEATLVPAVDELVKPVAQEAGEVHLPPLLPLLHRLVQARVVLERLVLHLLHGLAEVVQGHGQVQLACVADKLLRAEEEAEEDGRVHPHFLVLEPGEALAVVALALLRVG
mmetsp:Transcript_68021/g.175335  ORF Transcript_68021/g.175335 Transcript_68021/m.175335 type:complete len:201 (+) Transcript_68021:221-823(+)